MIASTQSLPSSDVLGSSGGHPLAVGALARTSMEPFIESNRIVRNHLICLLLLLLTGCVSPLTHNDPMPADQDKAYVIVAYEGDVPIFEARDCSILCTAWYRFGGNVSKDVNIFPVAVGTTFRINQVYAGLRVASFSGREIEIKTPGIYYFGLIQSVDPKLYYWPQPEPYVLRRAIEKYGTRIVDLTPVNFAWPQN